MAPAGSEGSGSSHQPGSGDLSFTLDPNCRRVVHPRLQSAAVSLGAWGLRLPWFLTFSWAAQVPALGLGNH